MNAKPPRTSCPSSDARPGAVLVGVVLPGRDLAYMTTRIPVDAEFLRIAREGRPPERRFRFSAPCAGGACHQWDGQGCGLIDRVLQTHAPAAQGPAACPIRDDCRWHVQHGDAACRVCPGVVTDSTGDGEDAGLPERVVRARERAASG